jgi:molecular chaperone GrpE
VTPQDNMEQPTASQKSTTASARNEDEPASQPQQPTSGAENEIDELKTQLEECKAETNKYLDQWRRTVAEFSNYRKRTERDQAEAKKERNADLITRLLPMLDDLDTAFTSLPADLNGQPWIEGMQLIHRKLHSIFAQEGLQEIETTGQSFDPALHEAVTHEPSETADEGRIIGELRRGYRLNDRILRPAQVRVSAGKPDGR